MKGTGEKELCIRKRSMCLSNVDLQDPLHQCFPIATISCGQFPLPIYSFIVYNKEWTYIVFCVSFSAEAYNIEEPWECDEGQLHQEIDFPT